MPGKYWNLSSFKINIPPKALAWVVFYCFVIGFIIKGFGKLLDIIF